MALSLQLSSLARLLVLRIATDLICLIISLFYVVRVALLMPWFGDLANFTRFGSFCSASVAMEFFVLSMACAFLETIFSHRKPLSVISVM